MTKLGQKQDLVEDKETKTSWSKVWAVCCLCLSTSLSRSMLKLRGNNQDAGKVLSKEDRNVFVQEIPTCVLPPPTLAGPASPSEALGSHIRRLTSPEKITHISVA